ncbi:hypothetical protein QA612_22140 [Evansella sp. AB-P1]|uniref:hypothetical protein n=1 Tax=Evansella sp. AB-P1 TaxID=3037653 RepID=UPI00241FE4B1|nr:hypothetical protein [Evansella sp. AB-P1]MDG5790143.1 hypothetical protein [Evansella sp. AB-P1]
MKKNQRETVMDYMEKNGGFSTLLELYSIVPTSNWKTKTPDATIRRIVQDKKWFTRIRPGLYALNDYMNRLPSHIKDLMNDKLELSEAKTSLHYFYQGILLQIGNFKGLETYIPPQDINKKFLNSTLDDISSIKKLPSFYISGYHKKYQDNRCYLV